MQKIKLELEVDLSNAAETAAFSNLIQVLSGGFKEAPIVAEAKEEDAPAPTPKPKKAKAKKAAPVVAEEKEEDESPAPEEEKVEASANFSDVRALMASKLQSGGEEVRAECIKELARLGAKTLPELKEKDYDGFVEFLENLGA